MKSSRPLVLWLTPALALAYWWAMRLVLAACVRSASGATMLSLVYATALPIGASLLALRTVPVGLTLPPRRDVVASLALGSCLVLPASFFVDLALRGVSTFGPWSLASRLPLRAAASDAALGQLLLLGVIVSAISEELFFRGVVFVRCRTVAPAWIAVVLSTLAFSLSHATAAAIAQACVLGVALGTVFGRTGSLTLCVLVHGAFNFQVCLLTCMLPATMTAVLPDYAADLPVSWLAPAILGVLGAWHALSRAPQVNHSATGGV